MAISSPGLGSGLDVTSIVSQLMEVERQPLIRLNQQESLVQAEISAYGTLKGGLSSLQDSLAKLKDALTFQATSATSSDTDILGVSSDTAALASSYNVKINRLAQQHKLGSAEFQSSATFGGAAGDAVTLTVGADSFVLDLSSAMTLAEIQEAINVDGNETGVAAGVITGNSGKQTLVLTSGESGYDSRVQLTFGGDLDDNTFDFSMFNRDAKDKLLTKVKRLDASLTVDGVAVTRGGNSISDVVEGLTLSLKSTGSANVTINKNSAIVSSAVEEFIDAHNAIKEQISTLGNSGLNGGLLRNLESQLRGVLNNGLSGLGDYSYISELGVTSDFATGELQLDSEMLITALEGNPDSVLSFFSDDTGGFAHNMDMLLESFLSSDGTIDSIVDSASGRVSSIERNRDAMERRLESVEQRYLTQFGALDTLMASMTTTSNYLTTQLDALSNMIGRSNN